MCVLISVGGAVGVQGVLAQIVHGRERSVSSMGAGRKGRMRGSDYANNYLNIKIIRAGDNNFD